GFTIFGRQLHTTSFITGLLIAGVGVLFWTTNGLVSAPSLVPASVLRAVKAYSGVLATPVWDVMVNIVMVVIVMTIWGMRRTKSQSGQSAPEERIEETSVQSRDA